MDYKSISVLSSHKTPSNVYDNNKNILKIKSRYKITILKMKLKNKSYQLSVFSESFSYEMN